MSMKNKFVTAVTTAGLLAGILGSAFVPSVKAGAGTLDATETTFSEALAGITAGAGTEASPYLITSDAASAAAAYALANVTFVVEDSNNAVIPANSTYSAATTGTIRISGAAANVSSKTGYVGNAGAVSIDVAVASATAAGTGTLVLTIGGGTETVYFRAVGPVATVTLKNAGATHLAGGTASTADKIEVTVADASGYALTAPTDAAVTWELAAGSAGAIGDVTEAGATDGKYNLTQDACDVAASLTSVGDTAKSFTFNAKVNSIASNTISIKCTDNGKYAVLTGAVLDAKSYDVATDPKVTYTFQDGFGNLIGEGGSVDVTGAAGAALEASMNITALGFNGKLLNGNVAVATYAPADGTITTAVGMGKVQQTITSTATALGKEWMVITVADSNLGVADDQAAKYTLRWAIIEPQPEDDATITKSKYTLTADFGDLGSKKKISFVVENVATGAVVTYVRKANAAGVAKYTIGRKGSFEVYAMLGDDVTETIAVKR